MKSWMAMVEFLGGRPEDPDNYNVAAMEDGCSTLNGIIADDRDDAEAMALKMAMVRENEKAQERKSQ